MDALAAKVLAWALRNVAAREGAPPERIVVTHPANWGPYKLELLDQAIMRAELGPAEVLSEPHAAALFYASTERVRLGATVLVYDLGGGTFDVAVLRKAPPASSSWARPRGSSTLAAWTSTRPSSATSRPPSTTTSISTIRRPHF